MRGSRPSRIRIACGKTVKKNDPLDPTERGFGEYFVYVKMPLIPAVQNSDQEFINMLIDSTKKCYTQKYLTETRKVTTAGLAIDKR